jgi:hypothetical protein
MYDRPIPIMFSKNGRWTHVVYLKRPTKRLRKYNNLKDLENIVIQKKNSKAWKPK